MRKLCLDLGKKTCGFAISDVGQTIAVGLENFFYEEYHFYEVINRIKYYLEESEFQGQIDEIILGLPLRMDLSESKTTKMVKKFATVLAKNITLPVRLQDERQSTKNAEAILSQGGYSAKQKKLKKDSLAAQLILEDYLERQHHEKSN